MDWCCLPDFHSPSTFGAILDADEGGEFTVTLPDGSTDRQRYEPGTNVLRTTLSSPCRPSTGRPATRRRPNCSPSSAACGRTSPTSARTRRRWSAGNWRPIARCEPTHRRRRGCSPSSAPATGG
ncbi:MAG: hypothetical protein ABEL76_00355 [Bradymonadaceae bacterium]